MMRGKKLRADLALGIIFWCFMVSGDELSLGRDAQCEPPALSEAVAHLGTGLKLFDLERYAEAAKEFELALKADPSLQDARYHLAVACFNEHRYNEARPQFEHLLAAGYRPDWETYYLGRIDLVEGDVDSAIHRLASLRRPEPVQDELYYLGSAFLKKGEPEKAIASLRRQIQFNPRDFRAHHLMARAYLQTGQRQAAEGEFEESEHLHQYYLEGKQELAACRMELQAGHTEQAWAACGSALRSDDVDKLVGVGMLFGEFGSYEHALLAFRRALELDSESPEVNYNLAFTYFQKKNYAQARQFAQAAVGQRPDFFEALALEGAVLYLLHEDAAATQALNHAHQLRPNDGAVNKLLAQLSSGSSQ